MSKQFAKLCSIVLTLVMLFNMLPHQILADMISTEEMEIPSGGIATETAELDTSAWTVVEEVTDKRTEFSKEFKMSNGLHMATVYNAAVHYEKNGTWEEIDNTLVATVSGTDSVYTNTAGVWDISFPAQLSSNNWISVTKDGYTLRFGMAGQLTNNGAVVASEGAATLNAAGQIGTEAFEIQAVQTTVAQVQQIDTDALRAEAEHPEIVADKLTSRLQYTNVYSNTNVVYDLQSNTLKESVVIGRYNSDLRGYRYTLDVGTMVPVLNEDNSIWFYDSNQENVIMVMPAPFMLDAANAYNGDVDVALYGSGSTYTLLYMLPQEWLAAEDRAWPVVLDPVINAENTPSNVRDVIVAENAVIDYLHPTNSCGYGQSWGVHRFYFRYEELPELALTDVIVGAYISMNKPVTHQNTDPVEVHKVETTWESQGLSWNNKPDFDPAIEDFVMSGPLGSYTWDVTDIVRGWYAGQNTGMMFKSSDAIEQAAVHNFEEFWSADIDFVNVPSLTVYFRNNNGLESYWDYTESSAGRAGTGYVNNYTGNLVWVHSDIGFGGNRMPVSISHVYNANDSQTNDFGLGYGWRTNFNQLVYLWDKDSNYYVWEDGDGTNHYFQFDSTGVYKDEDGLELTLTTTGSSTQKYCIADKYGNTSYFDTEGRLTKQMNNQATVSTIRISYTTSSGNLISSIIDGANRVYNFSYTNGLLSRISYRGTGTTELYHVAFGYTNSKLTSITYKDSKVVSYSYSGNLLTSATDIDGYKLEYGYSTPVSTWQPCRVLSITESDDGTERGTLTIQYGLRKTTLTDHDDKTQIIYFNSFGNAISVHDSEELTQFYQYETIAEEDESETDTSNPAKPTRLTAVSQKQDTVINLLSNTSFETGTAWAAGSSFASTGISTTVFCYGSKSLQSSATAYLVVGASYGTFTVAAGSSYTFSGYVKTVNGIARLRVKDDTGTYSDSELIAANSDWTRLAATYTNNTSSARTITVCVFHDTPGIVYIDGVQLEQNEIARSYNMLANSDSMIDSPWVIYSGSSTERPASSAGPYAPVLTANRLVIEGDPTAAQYVSQMVTISGNEGDCYVFSGWITGNSVPGNADGRFCGLKLTFYYANGTTSTVAIPADIKTESYWDWKHVGGYAIAEKAYYAIRVTAEHSYDPNVVYFDGLQLYKEEFGEIYTYDGNGNVTSVRDVLGQTTTYTYDSNHDLVTSVQESGQDSKVTVEYEFDGHHNMITSVTKYTVTEDESEETIVLSRYGYSYDEYGNLFKEMKTVKEDQQVSSIRIQQETRYTYTNSGNDLYSATDASGNTTYYGYDSETSVLKWVKYPNDTDATRTNYTYDNMFRLKNTSAVTDQGKTMSAAYTYDGDQILKISTPKTTYTLAHGAFGLRTGVSIGTRNLATYTYFDDENMYLEKLAYGNGDVVKYTYDDQGRVTQEAYYEDGSEAVSSTVTYVYDVAGTLISVADSRTNEVTRYHYDTLGRVIGQVDIIGEDIHGLWFTYDNQGRVTAIRDGYTGDSVTTEYTYDGAGRVTGIANGSTAEVYVYDGFGQLDEWYTYHGDSDTHFIRKNISYEMLDDRSGSSRPVVWSYVSTGTYGAVYNYTYDGNGNIISEKLDGKTTTYVYDSANQLIRENNEKAGKTWVWTYDAAGNILTKKEYAYTTGTLGTATSTITYGYDTTSGWGDLLTSYDGEPLYYDTIGNLVRDGDWDYTWEQGRQLTKMKHGSYAWEFTYDSNGMRTSRTNGTTTYTYVYSGSQLSRMLFGSTTMVFTYDANGRPLAVTYNGTTYYYVLNLQGDVVAILDSTGAAVVNYTYDAWGKPLTTTGSKASTLGQDNPLRYRGYVYDSGTGLYYLQSRYYNPTWGRFINADAFVSTGQGFLGNNMFSYCNNNPVAAWDESGMFPRDAVMSDHNGGIALAFYADAPVAPVKVSSSALKGVDVHGFKREFVGNSVSQWDVYKDTANGSILWLGNKSQTQWVGTGYFLADLYDYFLK